MRIAIVQSNVLINIIEAESAEAAQALHPEAECIPADDINAQIGSIRIDGEWRGPEAAGPQFLTSMSPVEFKMLFTPGERIAIRQAREYTGDDAAAKMTALLIDDWFGILDDPRLSAVNLTLPQTLAGLDMLVGAGILTQARREAIGRGMPA